ncbi:hypothetical protein G5I_07684 [Acromyrmex echinatior]|uniref:Uncharacterized protein n=1 Tax=Acromyrmex echinatior TaxID=103372 RepID=F4WPG9_ACREC|nr:hypothetical protein G5I_07684 [Acromyrmex echinatior]
MRTATAGEIQELAGITVIMEDEEKSPIVESSAPCLGTRLGVGLLSDSCGMFPGSSVLAAPEALADQCRVCKRRKLGVA